MGAIYVTVHRRHHVRGRQSALVVGLAGDILCRLEHLLGVRVVTVVGNHEVVLSWHPSEVDQTFLIFGRHDLYSSSIE